MEATVLHLAVPGLREGIRLRGTDTASSEELGGVLGERLLRLVLAIDEADGALVELDDGHAVALWTGPDAAVRATACAVRIVAGLAGDDGQPPRAGLATGEVHLSGPAPVTADGPPLTALVTTGQVVPEGGVLLDDATRAAVDIPCLRIGAGWLVTELGAEPLARSAPAPAQVRQRSVVLVRAPLAEPVTALRGVAGTATWLGHRVGRTSWEQQLLLDAPEAATHMALQVHKVLPDACIGVASGRVLLATVGATRVATGETVLLAEQLARTGQGIEVDRATFETCVERVLFDEVEARPLHGFEGPVPAWRAVQPRSRSAGWLSPRGPGLVGRAVERDLVATVLTGARVLVDGPAGIGKSALVSELLHTAGARSVLVLRGDPVERSEGWSAWQSVVRQLLGDDDRQAALLTRLGEVGLEAYAPVLNPVCDLELPDTVETKRLHGAARARWGDALLTALVEQAEPDALVVEDAQWLDSASWRLLAELAKHPARGVLVVGRSLAQAPPLDGAALELGGLARDDTAALVARCLGVSDAPAALVDWVQGVTRGHPFHVQELTLTLWQGGDLEVDDRGVRVVGALQDLALSPSLEAVLTRRIEDLPESDRAVLCHAAAVGLHGSRQAVEAALGVEVPSLPRSLRDAGLWRESGPDAWQLGHRLVQEAAYALIPAAERPAVHRRIAAWLEAEGAVEAAYPSLIHHWSHADAADQEAHYLRQAGVLALRQGAHREAAEALLRAQEVHPPSTAIDRATLARLRADAHFGLGELAVSDLHARQALAALDERLRSGLALLGPALRAVLGALGVRLGQGRVREELVQGALSAERLAQGLLFGTDPDALLAASLQAVDLAERSGSSVPVARSYALLGMVAAFGRLRLLSSRWFERARALAGADGAAEVFVGVAEATWRIGHGRWDAAGQTLTTTRALADELGDPQELEVVRVLQASWLLGVGRIKEAANACDELLAGARQRNNGQHEVWALNTLAQALLYLGRFDEAVLHLEDALALQEAADAPSAINTRGLLALALLRAGQRARALEAAVSATESLQGVVPRLFALHAGTAGVTEAWLGLWRAAERACEDASQLRAATRKALDHFAAFSRVFPIGLPRFKVYEGEALMLEGRRDRAIGSWETGLSEARRLGEPYDRALALDALGRNTPDPERRDELLAEASRLYRELGCSWHLAALARLG